MENPQKIRAAAAPRARGTEMGNNERNDMLTNDRVRATNWAKLAQMANDNSQAQPYEVSTALAKPGVLDELEHLIDLKGETYFAFHSFEVVKQPAMTGDFRIHNVCGTFKFESLDEAVRCATNQVNLAHLKEVVIETGDHFRPTTYRMGTDLVLTQDELRPKGRNFDEFLIVKDRHTGQRKMVGLHDEVDAFGREIVHCKTPKPSEFKAARRELNANRYMGTIFTKIPESAREATPEARAALLEAFKPTPKRPEVKPEPKAFVKPGPVAWCFRKRDNNLPWSESNAVPMY